MRTKMKAFQVLTVAVLGLIAITPQLRAQQSAPNTPDTKTPNGSEANAGDGPSPEVSDKISGGEGGNTMGCSFAASFGVVVCAELPSGAATAKAQYGQDLGAASATIQQTRVDATNVAASSVQALNSLQDPNNQDSADVSGAAAAIKQVQDSASKLAATTPPSPQDVVVPDPIIAGSEEKLPAYTAAQRAWVWGVMGVPGQLTQNESPDPSSATASSLTDGASDVNSVAQAQAQTNDNGNALEQYQQSLNQLNQYVWQHAKNSAPPIQPPQSSSAPFVNAPKTPAKVLQCASKDCSVH